MTDYRNPTPVVCILVKVNGGLLMVRRGLAEGFGQLAIPGGYQNVGETWQEAGAREVWEETGVHIDPDGIALTDVVTTPDGTKNLIFGTYMAPIWTNEFRLDSETLEVVVIKHKQRTAFPIHDAQVSDFFSRHVKNSDFGC